MMYEFRIRAKDIPSLNKMIVDAAAAIQGGTTPEISKEVVATKVAFPEIPACAVATPSVEVDSTGAPWNPAIHSSSRKKKKDGTWTLRRNSQADADGTESDEVAATPSLPTMPGVPSLPAMPMPSLPPLPQVDGVYSLATFKSNFPNIVADLVNQGKLTREYSKMLCQHFNIAELHMITQDDAKLRSVFETFVKLDWVKSAE